MHAAIPKNSKKNRVSALAITKKENLHESVCTLLQTRSTFSKSVMVFMGMSKLGQMDLIVSDGRLKIDGVYYREVLLTLKPL